MKRFQVSFKHSFFLETELEWYEIYVIVKKKKQCTMLSDLTVLANRPSGSQLGCIHTNNG